MPYLPTSQSYLEQSSLLLQAYPDTTRITTKYTFPSASTPSSLSSPSTRTQQSHPPPSDPQAGGPPTSTQSNATLTLKTFNPEAGICLKYQTNKAAEVGRLITSLGKLAAGADVSVLGGSSAAVAVGGGGAAGDVEMVDAGEEGVATATATTTTAAGKGGKSKKKSEKGKK
ncbi:hypothetical protein P175DRAFT_0554749 [Aspergillus ochraceoroseus IBT 24754]|uniref:SRP9 domain-containing protein n=2 Tax=Aspergillus ochraceoroseus TaxID=138278 RepID=A0A2T5MAI8_9EURO|nr:uncharacterized protein P175DRAFT_0554749 [Aspergillus ochraceoroseus IBT 24754]KKK23739.1 hypothetical protein AOCH_005438 [Aspergillus ochraceoroseus]PTU25515.1 hypothetical protein P175DRAFT_0554749 [Aspergillus ochraceoroseus IBT 24754]